MTPQEILELRTIRNFLELASQAPRGKSQMLNLGRALGRLEVFLIKTELQVHTTDVDEEGSA